VNHINVEEVMGTFPFDSFTTLEFYLVLEHHIYSYQEHLRANMHFPTEAIGRAITLTTPDGKRIRYTFCLEFKDF
jgi:hypothetical protein